MAPKRYSRTSVINLNLLFEDILWLHRADPLEHGRFRGEARAEREEEKRLSVRRRGAAQCFFEDEEDGR